MGMVGRGEVLNNSLSFYVKEVLHFNVSFSEIRNGGGWGGTPFWALSKGGAPVRGR